MAKLSLVPDILQLDLHQSSSTSTLFADLKGKNYTDSLRFETPVAINKLYGALTALDPRFYVGSTVRYRKDIPKAVYLTLREAADTE